MWHSGRTGRAGPLGLALVAALMVAFYLWGPGGRPPSTAALVSVRDQTAFALSFIGSPLAAIASPLVIPGGVIGVTTERGAPRSALVVPQSAIQLDQAGRYVLVVDDAKKVELRRVTTGVEQGRNIVVTQGLKEGELVIVEGVQKVRPGQVVTATVAPGNFTMIRVGVIPFGISVNPMTNTIYVANYASSTMS